MAVPSSSRSDLPATRTLIPGATLFSHQGAPGLQDMALPADLVDDFKQMAAADEAEEAEA